MRYLLGVKSKLFPAWRADHRRVYAVFYASQPETLPNRPIGSGLVWLLVIYYQAVPTGKPGARRVAVKVFASLLGAVEISADTRPARLVSSHHKGGKAEPPRNLGSLLALKASEWKRGWAPDVRMGLRVPFVRSAPLHMHGTAVEVTTVMQAPPAAATPESSRQLLTVSQAVEILNLAPATIYRLMQSGSSSASRLANPAGYRPAVLTHS
jgi:hypothetical protein